MYIEYETIDSISFVGLSEPMSVEAAITAIKNNALAEIKTSGEEGEIHNLPMKRFVTLLDVYDDVEEFAYDRLSDEETNELLEDVGSNTLLKIALDRLVDRGTIMSYNLRNGDATIICDL